MAGLDRCRACSAKLIEGPDVQRQGASERFSVKVDGIPTKVCPSGCDVSYWYWPDFGVEVLDALTRSTGGVARRRLGFRKTRHLCRQCGTELEDHGDRGTFLAKGRLRKGSDLNISIEAPCLTCPGCGAKSMPAQTSTHDPYYVELASLLGETVSEGLDRG
ncbi:MAG: hypothetical protein KKA32_14590 [Actinobacteria bacterium]|nr:hypothetical protein [Actinomycetota bacterium]